MKNLNKILFFTAAFFMCACITFTGCENGIIDIPDLDTTVSIANIPGVSVPVTGATVRRITNSTAEYTGNVAWDPAVTGTFDHDTAYTATITLAARAGFTFEGVPANFFRVTGATTVTNPANSGVITAVFPATEFDPDALKPKLPVLFENGEWTAAAGDITVTTPAGESSWKYENGFLTITNDTAANAMFMFRFNQMLDLTEYDSVIIEFEEAPAGSTGTLRFGTNNDVTWAGDSFISGGELTMKRGTGSVLVTPRVVDNINWTDTPHNWVVNKFRGVGLTLTGGDSVRIRKIYLDGTAIEDPDYPEPTQFVALTIDDGPSTNSNALMDVIESLGIKTTMFINGSNIYGNNISESDREYRRAAVERMVAAGQEIANHAFTHNNWSGTTYSVEQTRTDFQRNQDLIFELTGINTPWFRFPFYARGARSQGVLAEMQLIDVASGVDPNDWDHLGLPTPGPVTTGDVIRLLTVSGTGTNAARNGQIYLLHDQPNQTNTMRALPDIVHILRGRGIGFMTLTELRDHTGYRLPAYGQTVNRFF